MFNIYTQKPFIVTSILCLLLFLTASIFVNTAVYWHFFIIGGVLISYFQNPLHRLFFVVCSLSLCCLFLLTDNFAIGAAATLFGLLCSLLLLHKKQRFLIPFGIIAAAFLAHLFYIQQTDISLRQHDLSGIHYYMSKITEFGVNWKYFNSWSMYYLFHQPLHFILNGYLFIFLTYLDLSEHAALENLQYVSLFYVTVTTLLYAAILNKLQFSPMIRNALLGLMAFNPTLILFSGYISDDTPVLCWSLAVNYFLICWYQDEHLSDISAAAFCFAAGCLTKLSILLLVPAISVLFLYKLTVATNRRLIWMHICCFVIITVPISLLWIIRNHILFDMQFYNVPDTSPAGQNFYYLSLLSRLSDFSMALSPFISAPEIVDSNILLAILKTELFGEWDFSKTAPFILKPAYALYFLNILIHILILCSALRCLFLILRRVPEINRICMFFILQYITIWVYIFKYALDYPYICSTNYRLFAQLLLSGTLLGFAFSSFKRQEMASRCLLTISICYVSLVTIIYSLLIF